jgi:hypothetical protein
MPRPFFIFRTFEDEIEWFSVCGREVYAIGRAVQKHGFEKLPPFAVIAGKVQRISTTRERNGLKIHLSGNPNQSGL